MSNYWEIYHIINKIEYNDYLVRLFEKSIKCVLIYSTNHCRNGNAKHIHNREFTKWIDANINNFKLVETFENNLDVSAQFFLYKKF